MNSFELTVILLIFGLGLKVAHKIFGVPQTINCANYVYFLAYKELVNLRDAWTSNADHIVTGNEHSEITN